MNAEEMGRGGGQSGKSLLRAQRRRKEGGMGDGRMKREGTSRWVAREGRRRERGGLGIVKMDGRWEGAPKSE